MTKGVKAPATKPSQTQTQVSLMPKTHHGRELTREILLSSPTLVHEVSTHLYTQISNIVNGGGGNQHKNKAENTPNFTFLVFLNHGIISHSYENPQIEYHFKLKLNIFSLICHIISTPT